jgi:hypothetical protein
MRLFSTMLELINADSRGGGLRLERWALRLLALIGAALFADAVRKSVKRFLAANGLLAPVWELQDDTPGFGDLVSDVRNDVFDSGDVEARVDVLDAFVFELRLSS